MIRICKKCVIVCFALRGTPTKRDNALPRVASPGCEFKILQERSECVHR